MGSPSPSPSPSPCYSIPPTDRPPGEWRPLAHSYEEVLEKLEQNLSDASHLVFEIDQFLDKGLDDTERHDDDDEAFDLQLKPYFNHFNRIFFSGALARGRCSWKFVFFRNTDEWDRFGRSAFGMASDIRNCPGRGPHNIISDISVYQQHGQTLRGYVGTLLHEMLHAFIAVYVCGCPACSSRDFKSHGCTGHGETWQRCALAMENFAHSRLALGISLGRHRALNLEVETSGGGLDSLTLSLAELNLEEDEHGNIVSATS